MLKKRKPDSLGEVSAAHSVRPDTDNLRASILLIAQQLLETQGVAALSMREVARRAGVTHQAPYHHFGDREGILAALIEIGFENLASRLGDANHEALRLLDSRRSLTKANRHSLALASGSAYVGYAIENPGLFRLMFRSELCDLAQHGQSKAAGDKAYAQLQTMVQLLHGDQDNDVQCSLYWAQVHGLACLLLDGPLASQLQTSEAQYQLAQASLQLFARAMIDGMPVAKKGRQADGMDC